MPLKNREGGFLGIVGDKKPIAGTAGVIDRGVAPGIGGLGAGRAAGLHIGLVGIEQAKLFRVSLAGADHAIQGGQVFRLFNHFARAAQNSFGSKLAEAFQPQLFNLVEHLGIAVCLVVLVVIVNAKQGKDFIQRIYMIAADFVAARLRRAVITVPSCGR